MDPTNFLPEEVSDMIFCRLPVKDLLSCSLVSSHWRNAVNKDRMWKQHCNLETDLEDVECKVSPMFTLPPDHCEDLPPLCRYRQIYMRENHLRQNLLHNRWSTFELMKVNGYISKLEIFQGKFMILGRYPPRNPSQALRPMIIILDMEDDMKEVDRTNCLLVNTYINLLKSVENYIVVVQHDLFQMFTLVQGSLMLTICRILVNDEAVSLTMPVTQNDLERWYIENRQQTCSWCSSSLVDNKYCVTLAATHHSYNSFTLHFLEINSGHKMNMGPVPSLNQKSIVFDRDLNVRGDNIYIVLHILTNNDVDVDDDFDVSIKVMSFRLKALGVPEFCVDIPYSNKAYFAGKYIAIFPCEKDKTKYKIIDTTKGGDVSTRQVPHDIIWRTVDIHGTQLAFASNNNVYVLNTDTMLETAVLSIGLENSESLTNLEFINCELVQVWKRCEMNINTEVWDLKSCCKLYSLSPTNYGLMDVRVTRKSVFPKIYFKLDDDESMTLHVVNYW